MSLFIQNEPLWFFVIGQHTVANNENVNWNENDTWLSNVLQTELLKCGSEMYAASTL